MSGKVVVFGGNGFVGSTVLKELCARSVPAASVSRQGTRPKHLDKATWASTVDWNRGDATNAETYMKLLEGSRAVVIAIGSPPVPVSDESWQIMMNGETNCVIIEAAAKAGVPQVVLVNAMTPSWAPSGYVKGKAQARECAEKFASVTPKTSTGAKRGALILKPGAVYGTRHTASGLPIPLAPLLAPVSWGIKALPGVVTAATNALPTLLEGALVPPVSVEVLASIAVDGAMSDDYAGKITTLGAFELTK